MSDHEISVVVGGVQIKDWESYDITTSITSPTDTFSLSMPFTRAVWDRCKPEQPIKVLIDDVVILTGFLEERSIPEGDEIIEIGGRDRASRLVDESAPTLSFAGQTMKDLIERAADPWFTKVSFSNARNRNVIRGRGRKARAAADPVSLFASKKSAARTEPGQTRWQVIETLCSQAGLIAWSSGDGTELIVGKPNYQQEPQYRLFMPAADSTRVGESTVLGLGQSDSCASSYSRVIVVGSGPGTSVSYAANVVSRVGDVRENPATTDGEGLTFPEPKRLIVTRSVSSLAEARELAAQEMARRNARANAITARCPGHGQVVDSAAPTIFVPDTIASVEDERTGLVGNYLITACTYRSSRGDGEQTVLTLVPSGTDLSQL